MKKDVLFLVICYNEYIFKKGECDNKSQNEIMQKYLLASLKITSDTACYLYPQFEYDSNGQIHSIENKKNEYPERGTIFLPKKQNENLEEYLNKLIKISFDTENIASNYNPFDAYSNMCKYVAKISDIESLARDELVEIIEIKDKTIDEILRDKHARILPLNDLPLNNTFLIQIGEYCYGPFKYIPSEEEITTKKKIKIVPGDDFVFKYKNDDIEPYKNVAQVTSNNTDPKRYFIRNLSVLNDNVRIVEKMEFIDDETLFQEMQKVLTESKALENVNANADSVLRDLKNLLEKHPEIQGNHSILTQERIDRVISVLSKFNELDEYKQQIIDEYFKLGKVSEEEKLNFLQNHPEYLEDVIKKTTDYEKKIFELKNTLKNEENEVEKLNLEKEELTEEIEKLINDKDEYKSRILSSVQTEYEAVEKEVQELKKEKTIIDKGNKLAMEEKKNLQLEVSELEVDIENKVLKWLSTQRDNDIISLMISEIGKRKKEDKEETIENYNIQNYNNAKEIVDKVCDFFDKAGRTIERNEIINYLVTISENFMTVFAGKPGTGKTSTCNILAKSLGLYENRYASISVGRGWTSSRDLIGYYNSLTQTFEQTQPKFNKCLETLTREAQTELKDALYVVMLDEANLSQIEHYWADFIQISDDYDEAKIMIGNNKEYQLTEELRFLATINYDHTTEVLSPRFLDRAWIIRMEYKADNNLLTKALQSEKIDNEENIISYSDLKKYFNVSVDEMKNKQISSYSKEIIDTLNEQFAKAGYAISPRSIISMVKYCAVAEEYMDDKQNAIDYAVAQKLLPQINGNGKGYLEFLKEILGTCKYLAKSKEILNRIIETGEKEHNYFNYFNI